MQTQERSCVLVVQWCFYTYFNIIQPSIVQDGHGIPRTNKLFWSSIQGIKISLLLPPLYLLSVNHFYTYHICINTTSRWGKTPPRPPPCTSGQTHPPSALAHPHQAMQLCVWKAFNQKRSLIQTNWPGKVYNFWVRAREMQTFLITNKGQTDLINSSKKLIFIIQFVLGATVKRHIIDLVRSSKPVEFMYT